MVKGHSPKGQSSERFLNETCVSSEACQYFTESRVFGHLKALQFAPVVALGRKSLYLLAMIRSTLAILNLACTISAAAAAPDSCAFYWNKSLAMGCSLNDYLVSFGHKYCRQFERVHKDFSGPGQSTVLQIRRCLISALRDNREVTCSNVKSIALESHVSCYIENGFCEMSKADKGKILQVVAKELLDPAFAAVAFRIQNICGSAE